MRNTSIITVIICSVVSFYSFANELSSQIKRQYTPTILLSIDGFAHHYLEQYQPTNLLKLASKGVNAKALLPVFPTKTFPNHLSIVTGNYPSNHGLVHNKFYHRKLNKNYKLGIGKLDDTWVKSPTLWSIAERNNIKTAIYFWPESEINTKEYKPTYSFPYKHNTPNSDRFDQIVDWLKLPVAQRPELVLGYFSTIDSAGHDHGIHSKQLKESIQTFDQLLGDFIKRLENEVPDKVNIIIVSDHGMVDISEDTISYFYLFDGIETFQVVNGQTQLYVYLKENADDNNVLKAIKNNIKQQDSNRINVYNFNEYPKEWNFHTRSPEMPDIILEAIPPYTFATPKDKDAGTHGFDRRLSSTLNAIFIADGPSFKNNLTIEPFENIHIFPMFLQMYEIEINYKVDGEKDVLYPILQ